jgi:glyoxylase-like metal-dependent hydrolase (beta-lactamase superfamily II)
MYQSIHKLYDTLLDDTRVFVGHDYPSERPVSGTALNCKAVAKKRATAGEAQIVYFWES